MATQAMPEGPPAGDARHSIASLWTLEINMNGNQAFEKTPRKRGFDRNHPKTARRQLAQATAAHTLSHAPNVDSRQHMTLYGLKAAGAEAERLLTEHGIGMARVKDARVSGRCLVIELAYFRALDRLPGAVDLGYSGHDGARLWAIDVSPVCRLCWRHVETCHAPA